MDGFGRDVCSQLGLHPDAVRAITILCEPTDTHVIVDVEPKNAADFRPELVKYMLVPKEAEVS